MHGGEPVDVVLGGHPLADLAEPVEGGRVGGVVQPHDALAAVVVAHPADEEGQPAGGVVVEGVDDLGDVEGVLAQVDEAYGGAHPPDPRARRPATRVPWRP